MVAMTAPATRYNLGPADRIPLGQGRAFRVAGCQVAVFRTRDGGVYAVQAACPHRGGPLALGLVGAGKVVCPLHGYAFRLADGQPAGNPCAALRTYQVTTDAEGILWLTR